MEPHDAQDHPTDTILRGSNASVVLPIRPEAPESWFQRRVQADGSSRWGCKVSLRRARGERGSVRSCRGSSCARTRLGCQIFCGTARASPPTRWPRRRTAAFPKYIISEEGFHDRVVHPRNRAGRGAGFLGEGKVHFRRDGRAEGTPLSDLCRVPGDSCAQRRTGAATVPRTERRHDSRLRGGGRPSSLHHPQAAPHMNQTRRAATIDSMALQRILDHVEMFSADGAANEQVAGRLLHPLVQRASRQAAKLKNLKMAPRDKAHACRRLLSRTVVVDPELKSINDIMLFGTPSIARMLRDSRPCAEMFEQVLKYQRQPNGAGQVPGGAAGPKHLGYAKQRFDNSARPSALPCGTWTR